MPNWCANSLKLTPNTAENKELLSRLIKEFDEKQASDESPKFFELIKPCPSALKNTVAGFLGNGDEQKKLLEQQEVNMRVYGYANWYDFQIAEWGTKWEASDIDHEVRDGVLYLQFDTAWSPPIGIYEALENMGFSVEAGFIEQGVSYVGFYRDGIDHTEDIVYEADQTEDEDEYKDPFDIQEFFSKNYHIEHAPAHFGG